MTSKLNIAGAELLLAILPVTLKIKAVITATQAENDLRRIMQTRVGLGEYSFGQHANKESLNS